MQLASLGKSQKGRYRQSGGVNSRIAAKPVDSSEGEEEWLSHCPDTPRRAVWHLDAPKI